jgi:tyrosyl-tRNA synthetase
MAKGPREAKAIIAGDIVKRFHGEKAAKAAEEAFEKTFAKGGVPDDVLEVKFSKGDLLAELLVKAGVVESKADWRRLIDDGAVKTEKDEKVTDPNFVPRETMILKIGKRRFVKIIV